MTHINPIANAPSLILLCILFLSSYSPITNGQTKEIAPNDDPSEQNIRVKISVAQKRIVLGKTKHVDLSVKVSGPNGRKVDGCSIHINSNSGSFSEGHSESDGETSYKYILPNQFFPQFAIISVAANCSQGVGSNWIVVPLLGSGEVLVKSEPNMDVVLRVGNSTFGPVKANNKGRALIPIVASPGIKTGRAGARKIDLNLPSLNRISVATDNQVIAAKTGTARIWVYAIDKKGRPLRNAKLIFTTKKGTVTNLVNAGKGTYHAVYNPPRSDDDTTDVVGVQLKDSPASKGKLIFKINSGTATFISISSPQEHYRAGSDTGYILDVKLRDRQRTPTDGKVEISSNFGQVDAIRQIETGWYRTKLLIPNNFKKNKVAKVKVKATSPEGLHDAVQKSFEVKLSPSVPTQLSILDPTGRKPQSDGKSNYRLRISVQDEFGNQVGDVPIESSAQHGRTETILPSDSEYYQLIYTSPAPPLLNDFLKQDKVSVEISTPDGKIQTTREIPLSNREYLFALESTVGFISNFSNLNTALFSLRLDFNLWFIFSGLYASFDAGYFFDKQDADSLSVSSQIHGLPLLASIGYRIRVKHFVQLFANVGTGPLFVWHNIERQSTPSLKSFTVVPTVRFSLGAGFKLGPGELLFAVQYSLVKSNPLPEISGHLGGIGVTGGYRYSF